MLMAAQTGPAPTPAPPPPKPQMYVPQTWGEVMDSQKAFIAAAGPVMAVFFGILSAVVTAAKCPGMRAVARPQPMRRRARRS